MPVAELEKRRPERVSGDDRDAECGPAAALRRHLHRDVADGEEQPSRDSLRDGDRVEPAARRDDEEGGDRRAREPELDRERRAAAALAASSGERHGERDQPDDRDEHARDLVAGQGPAAHAGGHEREDADAARREALHERERGERQRDDVEAEARALEREAAQPIAIGEQDLQRAGRHAEREAGQGRDRVVLAQIGEVRQRRGRERKRNRDGGLGAHGPATLRRCAGTT